MPKSTQFEVRISSLSSEIWSKITKIDEMKGHWTGGVNLSPQILGRLKQSVLVTSAGASTRIEGAKLTDEEVEKLIQGIKVGKWKSRDEQEVRGYYELLKNVFDSWKALSLSESSIKHFHNEMLKYVSKDEKHKGEYKRMPNNVVMRDAKGKEIGIVFETVPPYLTSKKMQELVDWTKVALEEKKIHPLLAVGNFLVEFLNIHPFQDGNGRLSRILTNLLLLKEGYLYMPYISHEKLVEDNKNDYYIALRRSQKTFGTENENISDWLDYFLTILIKQSEMAVGLLESEQVEKLLSPKQLIVWEYFQTISEAAPGEIADKTKIARPTVNQALIKLLNLKIIEKIGSGRGTRYRKL
ncbi:MAG TPA: Fic family protein [Candidatus Moranbacteria bacterium]|nr:MAG: Filamentation induced by cAMP protein Fic [Candidatus Moranbacteria bacterium GW2011_GWF1_34_10]HBI16716.1 Fic family protein [Candidatus Moranbacteria bacterium]